MKVRFEGSKKEIRNDSEQSFHVNDRLFAPQKSIGRGKEYPLGCQE